MLTAFAIAYEIDQASILSALKHDGSEELFPGLPEPYNRRGFHCSELVEYGFKIGFKVVHIELKPYYTDADGCIRQVKRNAIVPDAKILAHNRSVLGVEAGGKQHAVAYDGHIVFDSNGFNYPLSRYNIDEVWLVF